MTKTFFFYDLETSGLNARSDRIMQFAGQRTDEHFEPIGDPYNVLIKLNDDTLPSPHAVMVTGITPQQTVDDGYTEAEFAQLLLDEVFTPDTITVGYNNVRFDDEFIRHLFWRTFRDPYEWAWRDGRSRWDMLDVVRMTRALRPNGINWPIVDGQEVNKLELLSAENGLTHTKAHDALSDVEALIGLTKLLAKQQPKLFAYLLKMRDKNEIKQLVNLDEKRAFVYASGRYDKAHHKSTVAFPLTAGKNGNVVVYDLRHDPTELVEKSIDELRAIMYAKAEERKASTYTPLPVKELQYNRCPAVAPLGVLEQEDGWTRLGLSKDIIAKHQAILEKHPAFAEALRTLIEERPAFEKNPDVEAQLYDGFVSDGDKKSIEAVRNANASKLADFHPNFIDERLPSLLLHYKARNYPRALSQDEMSEWETWRSERLRRSLVAYTAALTELSKTVDESKHFLLEELQLWAQAIVPFD